MAKLNAYLIFNGNCEEAMEFYRESLQGDLKLSKVGESPLAGQMPTEMHDKIFHSVLTSGDMVLMGTDMVGDKGYKPGNTVPLCLMCESKQEIETLFSRLAQGAVLTYPLQQAFFGTYGDLTDKYGFNWMFMFCTNEERESISTAATVG